MVRRRPLPAWLSEEDIASILEDMIKRMEALEYKLNQLKKGIEHE